MVHFASIAGMRGVDDMYTMCLVYSNLFVRDSARHKCPRSLSACLPFQADRRQVRPWELWLGRRGSILQLGRVCDSLLAATFCAAEVILIACTCMIGRRQVILPCEGADFCFDVCGVRLGPQGKPGESMHDSGNSTTRDLQQP